MLVRMFLGTDEAPYDRILDFSTAITGTLFFTPANDFFDDLPDAPEQEADAEQDLELGAAGIAALSAAAPSGDGSLGIGTLKRIPQ
jgi:putative iron-dependent peroxidase